MRRTGGLVAACAALVALALMGASALGTGAEPPPPRLAEQPAAAAPDASTVAPVHRAAAEPARLVGRCVAWESGAPLRGCRVTTSAGAVAFSDAGGHFELPLAVGDAPAMVEVAYGGRLATTRALRGHERALGDVRLRAATHLGGALHDDDGRPCAGCGVLVEVAAPARGDDWTERWPGAARTAADGTFAFDGALPEGPARLRAPGLRDLRGDTDMRLVGGAAAFAQLRCAPWSPADELTGQVLASHGAPLAGALVRAREHAAARGTLASAHTDADGRFRLLRPAGAPDVVALVAEERVGALVRIGALARAAWGGPSVALRVAADVAAVVEVVDADTGASIEGCELLRAGVGDDQRLAVVPADPRWLPSLPVAFDPGARVRVALQRALPQVVRVVDERGVAVAGANVTLLRPADSEVVRDVARPFDGGAARAAVNLRLAAATTDAGGAAALRWWRDPAALQLRVEGPGIAPRRLDGVRLVDGAPTVTVARAGRVRLELRGAAGHRVRLREVDGDGAAPPTWQDGFTLDAAGCADLEAPVGVYFVELSRELAGLWLPLPAARGDDPRARVRVEAGRVTRIVADVRAEVAVGAIAGTVLVDGAPATRAALQARDGMGRVVDLFSGPVDARGGFAFDGLPAGDYRVAAHTTCASRDVAVPGAWVRLPAGGRRDDLAVVVATGGAIVRLSGAERGLLLLVGEAGVVLHAAVGGGGEVAFERAPIGRYRVEWRGDGRRVELGEFAIEPARVVERTLALRRD